MNDYNGFSGEQRLRALAWARTGYADGSRKRAKECMACGQKEGLMDRHSEDYSEPFGPHIGAYHLCYTCHMMIHSRFRRPAAWHRYRDAVNAGVTFPPVYSRNYRLIATRYFGETFPEPDRVGPPPARLVLNEVRENGSTRAPIKTD